MASTDYTAEVFTLGTFLEGGPPDAPCEVHNVMGVVSASPDPFPSRIDMVLRLFDTTPAPTIGAPTPAEGAIAVTQTIVVDITSPASIAIKFIAVHYTNRNLTELAYNGVVFDSKFNSASNLANITGGVRATVIRNGNWPDDFTLSITVVDIYGTTSARDYTFTLTAGLRGVIIPYLSTSRVG